MKNLIKIMLFMTTVFLNTAFANGELDERIEFSWREVSSPPQLGNIKLYKDADGFHIIKNNKIYDVQNCLCDILLQKMTREQLKVFLGRKKPQSTIMTLEKLKQIYPKGLTNIDDKKAMLDQFLSGGYISVSQMSDGKYVLHANLDGKYWNRENKKAVIILLTAAAAASAYIAAVYYFLGDDPLFKEAISPLLHILASAGVGLVGGGLLGTGAAIINKDKGANFLEDVCLGAAIGELLGVGIGIGYEWHKLIEI